MARKKARAGTYKSAYTNKRRQGVLARVLPWTKRFGLTLSVIAVVLWVGAWFFLSDADTHTSDWVNNKIVTAAASLGFTVDDVLIEGRVYTDPEILKAILNTQKGDPLFAFDPDAAKQSIEEIAWVEKAHVERRWPDVLYIRLEERKPLALWQKNKKLKLIDNHGEIIPVNSLAPFKKFVIVMGENAPEKAEELFQVLVGEPELYKRIESVGLIADRRWDVIFDNDLRVKLPETDVAFALSRLAKAQKEDGILDKSLTGIDLRDPQRMIVRTKPGSSQEYQSGYSNASTASGNNI